MKDTRAWRLQERACSQCGQAFRPGRTGAETCSPRCAQAAYLAMLERFNRPRGTGPG